MNPISFDGCFGWFHPGDTSLGVVLCGPVGEEADYVYGVWREFAERLAGAGLSTLRFDYPGLGDSLDLDPERDPTTAWVDSIKAAMLWLTTEAAVQEVVIVGMRLGAGLALRCAEEIGGVARLVLIAPVASGTAFQRELALLAMLNEPGAPASQAAPSEAATVFTAEKTFDVADLRFARSAQKPARQVLILATHGSGAARSLGDRLALLGVEVMQEGFQGYAALMVRPETALYPELAFGKVVDWLRAEARALTDPSDPGAPRRPVTTALTPPGARETPHFFGDAARLFGVLCRPDAPRKGAPGILFLNTGAVPHAGMNRIWVSMARRYAANGFTSLRFDINGVGESAGRIEGADHQPVMKEALADVGAAIGWLKAQGCSTIILIGFCWGAQLAFSAALADDRVTHLIMINAARQFWDIETDSEPPRSLATYLRLLRDSAKWKNLRGGAISLADLAGFVGRLIFASMKSMIERVSGGGARSDKAIRKLRSLKARGVETAMFHGEDDTFLSEIEDNLRVGRHGLAGLSGMHTHFFPGVHHRFADDRSLAELVRVVGDHLSRLSRGKGARSDQAPGQSRAGHEHSPSTAAV
jgi:pimeloyl-ACP methyl ester carboxylesterase